MVNGSKKNVGVVLSKSGASFRVWAPFASSVSVTGSFNDWSEQPLESEGDGYWATTVKDAQAGQEYKYVIRNGDNTFVRNDPRARQLTTVAGNSVIVDPDFDWGNDSFTPLSQDKQVIYEMHIGTFNRKDPATTGTLETAAEKLDYLADLGVTTIELMPVGSMSMEREFWGYTPEYIFSVENLYGGQHQMLEFVKKAHDRGIGVILDVVYNHFGPAKNYDLWQFDGWQENGKGGIYFYNDWRSSTPWGETRPDYGRQEVRQLFLDNVSMWLVDFRLDGIRVDSTIFIRNAKGWNDDPGSDLPEGWQLLQSITSLAQKIKPDALVIAEDNGANEYLTKPVNEGGAGFTAQWQVNLPHAIRSALTVSNDEDRNIQAVVDYLMQNFNGDAFHRVIYSDSHDSAANGGSRLNEEISPGNPTSPYAQHRALLASAIVLTAPGIPMLLQGQEFLQGDSFNDWQALDWDKTEQFKGLVLAHKHLIDLRKNKHGNTSGLEGQHINVSHFNNGDKVIAYRRWDKGGPKDDAIVVINFSNKLLADYKVDFPRPGKWLVRFNSAWKGYSHEFKDVAVVDVKVEASAGNLVLPPYSAIVLSQDS